MIKFLLSIMLLLSTNNVSPAIDEAAGEVGKNIKLDAPKGEFSNLEKVVLCGLAAATAYIIYGYIDDYMHPEKIINRELDYLDEHYDFVLGLSCKVSKCGLESLKLKDIVIVDNCRLIVEKLKNWIKNAPEFPKDIAHNEKLLREMQASVDAYKDPFSKFDFEKIKKIVKAGSAAPYYI